MERQDEFVYVGNVTHDSEVLQVNTVSRRHDWSTDLPINNKVVHFKIDMKINRIFRFHQKVQGYIFSGVDCLSRKYHIEIDKSVKPAIHPTRKVTLPLIDILLESLDELEKSKIIEKVQGSSDGVNVLVLVR